MRAARWDTGAELGGGWRRTLRRRTSSTEPIDLAIGEPVTVRVWDEAGALDVHDQPRVPQVEVVGTVSTDRMLATLILTTNHIATIGVGEWEYAITITDPVSGQPEVLIRGYFHVSGSVSD